MPKSWARLMQRRPPTVEPRPSVLIVCEGEKTEKYYFEDLRSKEGIRLLDITVAHDHPAPESVVKCAIQKKAEAEKKSVVTQDANERYDEVWCVIDVDNHAGLDSAIKMASINGINLAISDPCFELWIILHVKDHNAPLRSQQMKAACRKAVLGYNGRFPDRLWNAYQDAVVRAKKLNKGALTNPGTRVYILTEHLLELGKTHALRKFLKATGRSKNSQPTKRK